MLLTLRHKLPRRCFRQLEQSPMGLTYGDMSFNVVLRFVVLFPFAIGAHIANNIYASGGIDHFISVISGHMVLAWTKLLVFGIYAFWAVEGLVQIVSPVWNKLVE